ncbi:type II secretion system protein M [Budviciaceae bacterium BWR-B9]|uniref:Type II secretion system protein M n=1 Tax=Limnobaculum allomyrinae TaxID=2791986 RepID=A0ABS1IU14_9GAMM|nr:MULTISPECIES: type II secretion system protein M [Limnobaculum]MBK5145241.1 type II secretion system protein M [Limnobaculum allomyrinae]MBV7693073.1 type II secretion system protein M [Limnobaculum sp. M2-1]
MKEKLIAYFNAKAPRERVLMVLGVITLLWGLLFYGLWIPLQNAVQDGWQAISRSQDTITWMQEQAEERDLPAYQLIADDPKQAIEQSAAQAKVTLAQMQMAANSADIIIDNLPFASLKSWLTTLNSTAGIRIENITMAPADNAGGVKVQLKLAWGPRG